MPADSYTVYFDYNIVYDYATDTTSLNGKIINVNYPGLGVLFHDVGKIVFGLEETWQQSTAPTTVSSKARTRTATRSLRSQADS